MAGRTQKELVQEIHTVLLGVPGTENGGLVQEVKDVKTDVKELGKSHGKLKRNFWILVGALIGSGAIGSGIYNLLGS